MLNYRLLGVAVSAAVIAATLGLSGSVRADDRENKNQSSNDRPNSSDRDDVSYHGRERAALGVTLSEQSDGQGVRIREVATGGPADKAGLREGDQIVSIDDQHVKGYRDVVKYVNRMQRDHTATIDVRRDGDEKSVKVDLAARDDIYRTASNNNGRRWSRDDSSNSNDGDNRSESNGRRQRAIMGVDLSQDDQGNLVIRDVRRDSGADRAGLRRGDEVLQVDEEEVSDRNDVRQELADHQPGDRISVTYRRDGEKDTAKVRLDAANDMTMQSGRTQNAHAYAGNNRRMADLRGRFGNRRWSINHEHPALGVTLREDDDGYLSIARVIDDSPADNAGLKRSDEVVSVDDQRVNSVSDVLRAIAHKDVGEKVTVRVRRDGDARDVNVKLASSDEIYSTARSNRSSDGASRDGNSRDSNRRDGDNDRNRQQSTSHDSEQD